MDGGLDNGVLGWSTDFVVCVVLVVLGRRLTGHHRAAGWSIALLGVGYLFGGLAHCCAYNRAFDDSCAHWAFYPVWIGSFAALGASAVTWLAVGAAQRPEGRPLSRVTLTVGAGLVLTTATLITGCLWCLTSTTATGLVDTCADRAAACDQVVLAAEGVYYVLWPMAWWVVAVQLAPAAHRAGRLASMANWIGPIALVLIGPALIDAVYLVAWLGGQNFGSLYADYAIAVVYHCGVLTSGVSSMVVAHRLGGSDGRSARCAAPPSRDPASTLLPSGSTR